MKQNEQTVTSVSKLVLIVEFLRHCNGNPRLATWLQLEQALRFVCKIF